MMMHIPASALMKILYPVLLMRSQLQTVPNNTTLLLDSQPDGPSSPHHNNENPVNIILFTTGLNPLSRVFHRLPENPIGIIELHSSEQDSRLVKLIRKLYKIATLKKFTNLEEYCANHGLHYEKIYKRDVARIKYVLNHWHGHLVITSRCPLVPMEALEDLSHGAINLHPSLLPSYRGGNPLFWQIHDQVEEIGVSVHKLNHKADTGPIVGQMTIKRPKAASQQELNRITEGELGVNCLSEVIRKIKHNTIHAVAQPKKSSTRYARNINFENFHDHVDMDAMNLLTLWELVHYFGHWPTELGKYQSWRKLFSWVPVDYTLNQRISRDAEVNGTVKYNYLTTWLMHSQGKIKLRPRINARLLLLALIKKSH